MSNTAEPTLEEMAAQLVAAGWRRKSGHFYKSPTGKLFLGPYGAWMVMTGKGKSPEFGERIVTGRP
jgi:hypothetical protein